MFVLNIKVATNFQKSLALKKNYAFAQTTKSVWPKFREHTLLALSNVFLSLGKKLIKGLIMNNLINNKKKDNIEQHNFSRPSFFWGLTYATLRILVLASN